MASDTGFGSSSAIDGAGKANVASKIPLEIAAVHRLFIFPRFVVRYASEDFDNGWAEAMGMTKAERKKRRQRLEETLKWVVDVHMRPLEEGVTTVTTAGVNDDFTAVEVTLNRRDKAFATMLVADSNGLVRVLDEPTIIDPL
ncbi:hypothetical protein ODJ79_14355 [Actinoplanes sp. KI2]|uniref:hypothetical protein n=1 Tax=Actinoplanes sp. KI2 TaxID=2983315 RepID=UPI0021D5A777|nr:hypothetical protein [Actinoplanes sp. KI2]MCU7724905.1 hypothetical protein [Actinoplanes sp. KI2]